MADDDNTVLHLLCHLAWLRKQLVTDGGSATIPWGYLVYTSAVELQWRYTYPHHDLEVMTPPTSFDFPRALENVVARASDALDVLREDKAGRVSGADLLPTDASNLIAGAIDDLLAVTERSHQVGKVVAKRKPDEGLVSPLRNLKRWASARRVKPPRANAREYASPAGEAQAELNKGIGTNLVATYAPAVSNMPQDAKAGVRKMAATMLDIDVEHRPSIHGYYQTDIPLDILENAKRSLIAKPQ